MRGVPLFFGFGTNTLSSIRCICGSLGLSDSLLPSNENDTRRVDSSSKMGFLRSLMTCYDRDIFKRAAILDPPCSIYLVIV